MLMLELGERLRLSRVEARLSLQDAADEVKLTRQAVAAWESGRTSISALHLACLALTYGKSADYLLFGVTAMPEELRVLLSKARNTA